MASSSKTVKRSKRNGTGKLTYNKIKIVYANAGGIKSRMQSLKQILLSKPCHIFAITGTLLKNNEKVKVQHYKWVGLNRKTKKREV